MTRGALENDLDPYATLGVPHDATPVQISHAYRRLAKELHPDLRGEGSADRMRAVNAAWEILSDPVNRRAWDAGRAVVAGGAQWRRGAPTAVAANRTASAGWAEWPAERAPRPEAAYPRRPRAEERRRSDSPWLVAAIGPAIAAVILLVAGVGSLLNPQQRSLAQEFEGFHQLDPPPTLNRAVAGTAFEVRFSFYGIQGSEVFASGSPTSRDVTCGTGEGERPDVRPAVNASVPSLSYHAPEHAWVYVWQSDAAWSGTCRELTFTFRDGSSRSVLFDFR